MDKIVVFDVETPNYKNDRICSIGLTVIENGEAAESKYYLVNPECGFDDRNIQIHGITPQDVADAPTFPEIWDTIGAMFHASLVAAHNATFDLCVLRKVLQAYELNEAFVYYIDTLTMTRSMIKNMENYRLPTLCGKFDIPLDHHNAASDSLACAMLLCRLIKDGADLNRYKKKYSLEATVLPEKSVGTVTSDSVPDYSCSCDSIEISGKSICLSGEFDCGSKADVSTKLINAGASIHSSVTQKTDILLIGGQGSSAWSCGKYGTKVKKALELKEKGFNIRLVREADFFVGFKG